MVVKFTILVPYRYFEQETAGSNLINDQIFSYFFEKKMNFQSFFVKSTF